ncbi:hypothetical protein DSM104635_03703 [Terricaulis silvestris]|uniref:Uncharacterized protein n=1 Tax=Terricaulis silvestris TaxID=2686094 RepID=A0A6I6MNB5_9CAUL|nr:hypothetical protein DSM104635_03703 [Terricaulis silvestris]
MLHAVAHNMLPHADNQVTELFKLRCSSCVERFLLFVVMRGAIDFHDQRGLVAKKIHNISTQRRLSAKAPTVELIAAQALPQNRLCDALRLAQALRGSPLEDVSLSPSRRFATPSPAARGEGLARHLIHKVRQRHVLIRHAAAVVR